MPGWRVIYLIDAFRQEEGAWEDHRVGVAVGVALRGAVANAFWGVWSRKNPRCLDWSARNNLNRWPMTRSEEWS